LFHCSVPLKAEQSGTKRNIKRNKTNMAERVALKKWFSTGNVLNGLFFAAIIAVLFIPAAKSILIRGLMGVGLFQPKTEQTASSLQAKDVIFRDSSGRTITLSSLKGKVAFINFWATWCPPCLAELPSINTLHKKLSNNSNIVFLIVDADNQLGKSVPFIKKNGYNLPVFETVTDIPSEMLSGLIPTTIVINKQGLIVFKHEGVADYSSDKFVEYLRKLAGN
jgi:thiol-disulfide isomerase/thioredoxin